MFSSGGVNICPAEIEAALITLPGVADCAVIGVPNAEFGESVAAFIQPAHGGAAPSAEDIRHALKGRIADYKIPRAFHFRAQLPRDRSEEHTSELQSLMRTSYAVFCMKKKRT